MAEVKLEKSTRTVNVNITNRTIIRILLFISGAFILFSAIRAAQSALVYIFTAFFLALALNGPVQWIATRLPGKRKGSRTLATGLSFFVVVLLLVGFLASIIPPLVRQTSNFINEIPSLVEQARDENSGIGRFVDRYDLQDDIDKYSRQLTERLDDIGGAAVDSARQVGSSVFAVLTILALTFMMLTEGPRRLKLLHELLPDKYQDRADRLGGDMYKVIKGYTNGQVILALLAAVLILPALLILHVSYPVALVVVVFICGLIPLVGHTIGAVIVSIVALFHSPWSALFILCYYILYQQIENYIIQPRIQANSTNMSPLLVFSSVIIGVNFGGLLGGLVAIPVAGCIRIALIDYLHSKKIIKESTYREVVTTKRPDQDAEIV